MILTRDQVEPVSWRGGEQSTRALKRRAHPTRSSSWKPRYARTSALVSVCAELLAPRPWSAAGRGEPRGAGLCALPLFDFVLGVELERLRRFKCCGFFFRFFADRVDELLDQALFAGADREVYAALPGHLVGRFGPPAG